MTSTAQPRLESAIRKGLAPVLRADGFKGSGRRFHKEVGPWLQVLTVQGSKWSGSFAVNLGIHHTREPDAIGNPVCPGKMTEASCEFQRRLSEDKTDQWWDYEANEEAMLAAVCSVSDLYIRRGREYFSSAIKALDSITPESLVAGAFDFQGFGTTKVRLGLALARIRKIEGKGEQSRAFAAYGLAHLGSASALRAELTALAAE